MDFEEKIDAMRMTLELAIHDIEAQRAAIQEQRAAVQEQRVAIQEQRVAIQEQRVATQALGANIAEVNENSQVLMKACENLLKTAEIHERRITGLEGRT
jgi:chromosome segregation ATPase